ncbi:hypothetical protein IQ216_13030 [Cyanobium sp. LEGE 06143]|uniref:hypothetical protein n=1 Tax=Cyanobium sp. LEGE 06143 TaxID=945727 RepID=UPI00187EC8EA|nr:hypothetical protein [Cyanobium sp. LEGE 06143]MBE9173958.1 hypothetical protein [Cyanobium sp. LEGE 06143]
MSQTLAFGQGGFTLSASTETGDQKLEGFERRGRIQFFNNDGSPIVGLNLDGSAGGESVRLRTGSPSEGRGSRKDVVSRRLDADLGGGDDTLVIGGISRKASVDLGEGDDRLVSQGDFKRSNLDAGTGDDVLRFKGVQNSIIDSGDGDDRLVFGNVAKSRINTGNGADTVRFRGDVRDTNLNLGGRDGDRDVVRLSDDADIRGLRIRGADDNDVLFIGSSKYEYDGGRNWVNVDDADDNVRF